MMEPMDLFSALTDVDDQDVLEALDVYTRKPKQKRARRIITVAATLIVAALVGIATHRYLQGKGKMDEKSPQDVESSMEYITITPSIVEKKPTVLDEETPICTIYQFMLFGEAEYVASVENCERIGNEIGTARVRNEERESTKTLFKDVVIYEFVGMESAIAVVVYYPEEQEYYVYYSANY